MPYTSREIRSATRYLTARQIDKEGLTPDEIMQAAMADGYLPPNSTPIAPPQTPDLEPFPKPKTGLAAQVSPTPIEAVPQTATTATQAELLAQLMATMQQPQAPAPATMDEQAIKAMVEKYANPVTTLQIEQPKQPTVSIKGAHKELERVVKRLNAGYKVYLYGPAGSGKTTLCKQAAEALNLSFYHTGALLMKYELTGFNDAGGSFVSTSFYEAYKNGGVYLFDEIDASSPQAVIAFNMAIENGEMTFPNEKVQQHKDFRVIAAANTNGQGATTNYKRNALDGATLDRFSRIAMDYDEKLELRLATDEYKRLGGKAPHEVGNWVNFIQKTRAIAKDKKIDVIISPRSSKNGAGILAMGDDKETAIKETFGASLSTDQRRQLGINF